MVLGGIACLWVGATSGVQADINFGTRFIHILSNGEIVPWLVLYGLVFGFAYGVHYKKVGSWIQSPSGGMKPNVDELSMGAVSRMEAKARAEESDADQ